MALLFLTRRDDGGGGGHGKAPRAAPWGQAEILEQRPLHEASLGLWDGQSWAIDSIWAVVHIWAIHIWADVHIWAVVSPTQAVVAGSREPLPPPDSSGCIAVLQPAP